MTLNFSLPVHLSPGLYWLVIAIDNADMVQIHIASSDTNQIIQSATNNAISPMSLLYPLYMFGRATCIYATWQFSSAEETPSPSSTSEPTPTPSASLNTTSNLPVEIIAAAIVVAVFVFAVVVLRKLMTSKTP
jgi:hypothetical protein